MNKRNRLTAALLVILMVFSCFSVVVFADKEAVVVTYAIIGERDVYHTQTLNGKSAIGSSNYPADPVREGKKFTGWFYNTAEGRVFVDTSFVPNEDITLLTVLEDVPVFYTVTYAIPGEGVYCVRTAEKGKSIADCDMPDNPASLKGCFDGWYYNENGGKIDVDSDFVPVGDITLLSRWKSSHTWNYDAATEEHDKHCVECGYLAEAKLPHKHVGTLVEAVPATCAENGNTAYYVCTCGEWFSDAECSIVITDHNSVITDTVPHSGGEATCSKPAVCTVCGVEYGELDASNHKNTELRGVKTATEEEEGYTGDVYCTDCGNILERGNVIEKLKHTHKMTAFDEKAASCTANGNIAYWYCTVCEKYFSDADAVNEITLDDTVIKQLSHNYTELQSNDEGHWYKCALCGDITKLEAHTGGTATCTKKAVCEICGAEYGETDPDNHTGEVYIVGQKDATCYEEGYTGDKYCKDCDKMISAGTVIATVDHNISDTWSVDENSHWKVCENAGCENVFDKAQHTGGTATCTKKAVCEICGAEYGETDPDNHTGEVYIVGQKEATCYEEGYTGDKYCKDCDKRISAGSVIATGEHTPSTVWSTDEDSHWKECETVGCGNIIDKAHHTGGTATCNSKAICDVCGVEYGPYNPDIHGETELRDAVEATCSEDGYSGDIYCKDCGQLISMGSVIEKSGHSFGDWIVAKEATADSDGIRERVCLTCGYTETEVIHAAPNPADDPGEDTTGDNGGTDSETNVDTAVDTNSDTKDTSPETTAPVNADKANGVPDMSDNISTIAVSLVIMLVFAFGITVIMICTKKKRVK